MRFRMTIGVPWTSFHAVPIPERAIAAVPWVICDGYDGPGKGKHSFVVTGEDE